MKASSARIARRGLGTLCGAALARFRLGAGYALPDDPELGAETRRRLTELRAIETLPDRAYQLQWTTRITFHWMQTIGNHPSSTAP